MAGRVKRRAKSGGGKQASFAFALVECQRHLVDDPQRRVPGLGRARDRAADDQVIGAAHHRVIGGGRSYLVVSSGPGRPDTRRDDQKIRGWDSGPNQFDFVWRCDHPVASRLRGGDRAALDKLA